MQGFFPGIAVGIILTQTALLAPVIFRTLDAASAGKVLRSLFPKFFLILAGVSVASLAAQLLRSDRTPLAVALPAVCVVLPLICYALVPATNRATDSNDAATFRTLHRLSVALTVVVLGASAATPFV